MIATATRYGEHPAGIVWTKGETRTVRASWLPLPPWLVIADEPGPTLTEAPEAPSDPIPAPPPTAAEE